MNLNKNQQQELLGIARKTLQSYLKNNQIPKTNVIGPVLKQNLGAFVTLKTKTGQLRGCIGEFESDKPLLQVVQEKVIDAAVNDPRFESLQYKELPNIKVEISVLSPLKKIHDWKKIILGKHGVMIKKSLNKGVFLPQVALETHWDLETFLGNLCFYKAGLPFNCYQEPETEIYIFTAQVFEE